MRLLFSIGSLLDRLCLVAGAFVGSQIPPFMQQYSQRLAGHVSELHHMLEKLQSVAALSNKTLEQYIHKFLSSSDPDFVNQGHYMQGVVQRWQDLHDAATNLAQSSLWGRPFVFLKNLQPDIANSALADFQPALNLSIEGICYAGVGMMLGWICFQGMTRILKSIRSIFFVRGQAIKACD